MVKGSSSSVSLLGAAEIFVNARLSSFEAELAEEDASLSCADGKTLVFFNVDEGEIRMLSDLWTRQSTDSQNTSTTHSDDVATASEDTI